MPISIFIYARIHSFIPFYSWHWYGNGFSFIYMFNWFFVCLFKWFWLRSLIVFPSVWFSFHLPLIERTQPHFRNVKFKFSMSGIISSFFLFEKSHYVSFNGNSLRFWFAKYICDFFEFAIKIHFIRLFLNCTSFLRSVSNTIIIK